MEKQCTRCKISKELELFNVNLRGKLGRCSICKECRKEDTKKYREINKESNKIYKHKYYQENKLDILKKKSEKKYWKKYYDNNKEKSKDSNKRYREKNKSLIYEKSNLYRKNRRNNDDLYRLSTNIRGYIGTYFRSKKYNKNNRVQKILGCSLIDLKYYLESNFEPWMNWENYGLYNGELNYGWDIDHIIPTSSATTPEELIKLCHYTNLQPLCSNVNRNIKRNKIPL